MSSHRTETSEPGPELDAAPQVWSDATAADGLDARLQVAHLDAGARVAVRESRHPAGPALLFTADDWRVLLGRRPDVVDLRGR